MASISQPSSPRFESSVGITPLHSESHQPWCYRVRHITLYSHCNAIATLPAFLAVVPVLLDQRLQLLPLPQMRGLPYGGALRLPSTRSTVPEAHPGLAPVCYSGTIVERLFWRRA